MAQVCGCADLWAKRDGRTGELVRRNTFSRVGSLLGWLIEWSTRRGVRANVRPSRDRGAFLLRVWIYGYDAYAFVRM